MKIALMTNTGPTALVALEVIKNSGHELSAIVLSEKEVKDVLFYNKAVTVYHNFRSLMKTEEELINSELSEYDLIISFCYPSLIKEPLISGPKYGSINLHPAPLPKYRGFAVYNFGILNNEQRWGVTAHYMDESFDTGDIIKIINFNIDSRETATSLRRKSHDHLLGLLNEILSDLKRKNILPSTKQGSDGNYYSKKRLEKERKIQKSDSKEVIERKVRAFWCPPFHGASIELQGEEFTVVSTELLKTLWRKNG